MSIRARGMLRQSLRPDRIAHLFWGDVMQDHNSDAMNAQEKRAASGLSLVFAFRMQNEML